MKEQKPSFWGTLPGIITALSALIGALAALLTALYTAEIIGPSLKNRESSGMTEPAVINTPVKQVVPSKVDRTNAKETAHAILSAYRTRDVIALASLVNTTNRRIFIELAEQGEKHPRYNSVFLGWRWQAVQAWNGNLG